MTKIVDKGINCAPCGKFCALCGKPVWKSNMEILGGKLLQKANVEIPCGECIWKASVESSYGKCMRKAHAGHRPRPSCRPRPHRSHTVQCLPLVCANIDNRNYD